MLWIRATERGTQLQVSAPQIAADTHGGDSIAVNGCCLTVAAHRAEQLTFDLLEETLDRTNLKTLRRESPVNLERALRSGVKKPPAAKKRLLPFSSASPWKGASLPRT